LFGDLRAIVVVVVTDGGADLIPCRFVVGGVGSDPGTAVTSGGSFWFDPGDRLAFRASWDRRSAVAAVGVVIAIIGGGADLIPCRFVDGGVGSNPDTSSTSGGSSWLDPGDRLAVRASWDRRRAVAAVVVVSGRPLLLLRRLWKRPASSRAQSATLRRRHHRRSRPRCARH
jgi:hypothetical protein